MIGDASGEVDGVVLEAAAALGPDDPVSGFLLFLTMGVPYEDALAITFTDPLLRPLDRAQIGGMYVTGRWEDPVVEGPGLIAFDFIDERRWCVELLRAPELRFPREPRGVSRRFGLYRRLRLAAGPRYPARADALT